MVNGRLRPAPREAQRGAAVFIVVMVLSLVTALGIFAVRSASLAATAAGYDREAAQTSLLAQHATSAVAAYLSGPGAFALDHMNQSAVKCASTNGANTYCSTFALSDLDDPKTTQMLGPMLGAASLNANGLITGDFWVELTEATGTGGLVGGGGGSKNKTPTTVTVTVTAQVRPTGAACGVALNSNAGQQVVRALITK